MQQNTQSTPMATPVPGDYLLDVSGRFITYEDIICLPLLFGHGGSPVEIRCDGLEDGHDAYNPSPVVRAKAHRSDTETVPVIAIRTERRASPFVPETRFCRYDPSGLCIELPGVARKPWEDPHMVVLPDGRIVAYGVHVEWNDVDPTIAERFATEFYIGESLDRLTFLGRSPYGHKDTRLIVRRNGSLGLYARPQQRRYEGKIAYVDLANIEELASDQPLGSSAAYARVLPVGLGIFGEGTWGGPNDAQDLGNGWDLVNCHIATVLGADDTQDERPVAYSGFMMFRHQQSGRVMVARPHALAADFPSMEVYKRPALREVVFPAGVHDLEVAEEGTLRGTAIYGLRDAQAYARPIESIAPVLSLLAA